MLLFLCFFREFLAKMLNIVVSLPQRNPKKLITMKQIYSLFSLSLLAAFMTSSCCGGEEPAAPTEQKHLVESTSIVGLWQQMKVTEIIDEATGEEIEQQTPRPRYKCIMADGTYYLLNVELGEDGSGRSTIIHYGSYSIVGDSLEIEHIEVCPSVPNLNGHDSHVRYSLPDNNTMSLYYKFALEEGIPGSTEWNPEIWKRVQMIQ